MNDNLQPEWSPVSAVKPDAAELYAALFREKFPQWAARSNGRIERAIKICSTPGACQRSDLPGVYMVRSQHNPRGWYTVDVNAKTCTCPDAGNPQTICKHRLAIAFHLYGPEWQLELRAPAVYAANLEYERLVKAQLEEQGNLNLAFLVGNLTLDEFRQQFAELMKAHKAALSKYEF